MPNTKYVTGTVRNLYRYRTKYDRIFQPGQLNFLHLPLGPGHVPDPAGLVPGPGRDPVAPGPDLGPVAVAPAATPSPSPGRGAEARSVRAPSRGPHLGKLSVLVDLTIVEEAGYRYPQLFSASGRADPFLWLGCLFRRSGLAPP